MHWKYTIYGDLKVNSGLTEFWKRQIPEHRVFHVIIIIIIQPGMRPERVV